ncbi:DUF84 family protein [Chryseomicrobium palamuruense]|uniref:Probable inosine/xanthosine triphosphatase n=1 Tax=Chryseomicrobium palamuruense TaxID=682973 RepID=A0ABV8UZ92_9BACL
MKIVIGTTNKAKISAVREAFLKVGIMAEFHGVEANSLVSAQPLNDEETVKGAINRAKDTLKKEQGDLGIGLEGGVKWVNETLYLCNWGAMVTRSGHLYTATGAGLPLPPEIEMGIKKGHELGPLMDVYTNQKGIRHHEGAIGIFTNGLITRSDMFEHVVIQLIGQWQRENSVV